MCIAQQFSNRIDSGVGHLRTNARLAALKVCTAFSGPVNGQPENLTFADDSILIINYHPNGKVESTDWKMRSDLQDVWNSIKSHSEV